MQHTEALFRQNGQKKIFPKHSLLFQRDDPAEVLYYLVSGCVRAYFSYPDGTEKVICYVEDGNLVGEEVLKDSPRRIVDVDAVRDTVLYSLSREQIDLLCEEDPSFRSNLMKMMMQKIDLLTHWIYYSRFSTGEERLSCFLADHMDDSRTVSFTQTDIARVTGLSRISVGNILKNFESQGIIIRQYGKVYIKDQKKLQAMFEKQPDSKK